MATSAKKASKSSTDLRDELHSNMDKLRGEFEAIHAETKTKISDIEIKQAAPVYTGNTSKYSDIFGTPPSGIDHAVPMFKAEDWNEVVRPFIPKIDPTYIPPPESTEKLVVGFINGDKSFIHGKTGSGKSSLVKHICAVLNIPFIRVNFSADMESSALFGEHTVRIDEETGNNKVVFEDGPLLELGRYGGVLCCDEFSTGPAEVNMSLQWVLEDEGKIYVKDMAGSSVDKLIEPNEWFRIVCTDNTELQGDTSGNHAGTSVQNSALLDRFQTTIRHDYLDPDIEAEIMSTVAPELDKLIIKKMVEMGKLIRKCYGDQGMNITMSQRTLNNWAKKTLYWGDLMIAFKVTFFDKLIEDDQKVVNEFLNKVFGEEIRSK